MDNTDNTAQIKCGLLSEEESEWDSERDRVKALRGTRSIQEIQFICYSLVSIFFDMNIQ